MKNNINNFLRFLPDMARETLFPTGCAICGKTLLDGEDAWYGICKVCRKKVENEDTERGLERCSVCGRPLISEIGECLQCRKTEAQNEESGCSRHFDRIVSLFPYTGDYRALLTAYKFRKTQAVGNFLAEKLLAAFALFPQGLLANPTLVPVPPRPGKIRQTGWDQIEHLARILEKKWKAEVKEAKMQRPAAESCEARSNSHPVFRCLKRLPSVSQKQLNKQSRLTNLLSRIRCTKTPPAEIVLFDDVITTGSTMDACAATLKASGAHKVFGICLFYD
jgi:predicted amidophosphoribosyltransferase